jgi:transcriptional regulator with XRE-family HTH domain
VKTIDFDSYLEEQLKRPELRKAYDDLEEEYELAKQVIRFRLSRNLTQAQLARLAGTSQPAIERLESGNNRNMTLGFIARVVRALGLRPEMKFVPLRGSRTRHHESSERLMPRKLTKKRGKAATR